MAETHEELRPLIRGGIQMHPGMREGGIPVPLLAAKFVDVFDRE